MDPTAVIDDQGTTVGQLQNMGWNQSDILNYGAGNGYDVSSLLASGGGFGALAPSPAPAPALRSAPAPVVSSAAASSSSWASGIAAFGSALTSVLKTVNPPTTTLINPTTGLPYTTTINPATGLPYAAPTTTSQSFFVLILFAALLWYFVQAK